MGSPRLRAHVQAGLRERPRSARCRDGARPARPVVRRLQPPGTSLGAWHAPARGVSGEPRKPRTHTPICLANRGADHVGSSVDLKRAHNPKVAGSNPAPATIENEGLADAKAANPFRLPRLHPGIGSCRCAPRADGRTAAAPLSWAEGAGLFAAGIKYPNGDPTPACACVEWSAAVCSVPTVA